MSLILYNAKIYTMDENKSKVDALYIENDKIIHIGTNEEILSYKTDDTKLIDCKNKTIIPGLNDSHMHLYNFGVSLQMVNLYDVKSIDELIKKVINFINNKNIDENTWIRGRGWNQDYFIDEKRFPNRLDLDKISTNHPIVLSRACGHVVVVNTKALEICGINKETPLVEGGEFDIDSGIFRENAISLIMENIPNPSISDVKNTLLEAIKYANSQGLTSIQTDDLSSLPSENFKLLIQAYEELRKENKLTCRIYEQCLLTSKEKLDDFLSYGYKTGIGDIYLKLGPLKILSDGSLGARTAALTKPYADDKSTNGITCFSQEELDDLIIYAHNKGMQIAVHCIGDRSMNMVLESYEKALKENYRDNHRHGIIHCQITDEKIINKYKELNVLALVQPIFLHYDLHIVERRVGKELASTSYAFKTMIDKGIHTSFGTDCPVEPLDTMSNIYCAVTRQDLNGNPRGGWNQKEKVSIYEAIYHYTKESAYASFEENIKGSISEGKLADIVVLNEDIFTIDVNNIKDVLVDMTFVGGNLVYSRK